MKRKLPFSVILMSLTFLLSVVAQGQVLITSSADSTAILNETYTYDVEVITIPPDAPVTFSLDKKPSGMTINASTGLISWIPTSIYQGTEVVVKATLSAEQTSTQSYYLYVTDAVECPETLTSYWSFDSKVGTTIPDQANSYDAEFVGIATNEPTLVEGKVGMAGSFDPQAPSSTFYEVADQDQYEWIYDTSFTISMWFKNNPSILEVKEPETLIGRASSEGVPSSWTLQWVYDNNWVGFYIRSRNATDTIAWKDKTVADQNWHHAAVTFSGSQFGTSDIVVYIDNERKTTFKQFGEDGSVVTRFDNITPVTIGHWNEYAPVTYPFSGLLDEVAIFSQGLTDAQITQVYNRGLAGLPVCQEGNFTPIITSEAITSGTEDEAYTYTLTARDYEKTPLTLSAVVKPDWLNFNASTGVLSGTPTNDEVGDHDVTLRVSDGATEVDQVFTISVANVNDDPVITSTPDTEVDEDEAYSYTFVATDVDVSDVLTLSAPVKPDWLSFNASTGELSGTPTGNDVGDHDVTLRVSDGTVDIDQDFTIAVSNVNDAPEITSTPSLTARVNQLYTYTLVATDEDEDELTYLTSSLPSWLTFNSTTHVLSGTPEMADMGNNNVILAVYDGQETTQQSFTIEVSGPSAIDDRTEAFATVYPVPSSDYVIFEFPVKLGNATLEIFNANGSLVKRLDISGIASYKLDVSGMNPNQYLYRITADDKLQNGAIIVK